MAGPQSYPSPTSAETQAGAPFYHTSNPTATDGAALPTADVPDVSLDAGGGRDDMNVSQLERLHNEIVAQIHPDLDSAAAAAASASNVALAAASSAADAAAAIAASDAHQQLARQVMSLGGVDVDAAEDGAGAHTPPFQIGEEGAMTPGGGPPGAMPGSAKVRSKVSRACDECRRKKVGRFVSLRLALVTNALDSYSQAVILSLSYYHLQSVFVLESVHHLQSV
jgi:hypothetical protein